MSPSSPARAVYTALIGKYESLAPQPIARESAVPFICFTDDPEFTSNDWTIVVVDPILPLDPTRSARHLKIQGHPELSKYDETLWIDGSVQLTRLPESILEEWLANSDFALPRHSFRMDVVTEFEEVLALGFDDSSRLYEQLTHYATTGADALLGEVPWTAMLARRNTARLRAAMNEWFLHVLRYSRRDQLSFVEAMRRAGCEYALVELDNHLSALHRWPVSSGRSTRPPQFRISESLQPPVAQIGMLRLELERTVSALGTVHRG